MPKEIDVNFNFSPPPRPPLGIKPQYMWLDERIKELARAIGRYAETDTTDAEQLIEEWAKEIVRLRKLYNEG